MGEGVVCELKQLKSQSSIIDGTRNEKNGRYLDDEFPM
jgi:hypothetical protein